MEVLEERIQRTFVELVGRGKVTNPPTISLSKDGHSQYSSDSGHIEIRKADAKNSSLDFIIAHELAHHEQQRNPFLCGKTAYELHRIAALSVLTGTISSAISTIFGQNNNVGFNFLAFGFLTKFLQVAQSYYQEFQADTYAAQLTSPEQGIRFFSRSQEVSRLVNHSLKAMTAGVSITLPGEPEKSKQLERMLNQLLEQPRENARAQLAKNRASELMDLLVHPPHSWRIYELQRLAQQQHEANTAKVI